VTGWVALFGKIFTKAARSSDGRRRQGTPEPDFDGVVAYFSRPPGGGETRRAAQAELLHRYRGAIDRYLGSVVHDEYAAEDLCQEFAYRFVRGVFHRANPAKGRFRDFVKTAIAHLIADWRRRQARHQPLPLDTTLLGAVASPESDPGQKFEDLWRAELLDRVSEQLAQLQKEGEKEGSWFCTALRHRAEFPDQTAAQMADEVGRQLGRPLTEENVRQTLHRGREKFADLLLDEVARSLETSSPGQLRDELTELGLLSYCRTALEQRGLG
jgi:RNA polymerase sigma-70 factor (ECF subfamily)